MRISINDIKNLSEIVKRNMFPKWPKGYLSKVRTTGKYASKRKTSNSHFYRLPYIGYSSSFTGRKILSIINKYCKRRVEFPVTSGNSPGQNDYRNQTHGI